MKNRELITAFRQGGEGNCVTIAIIKAGIEIFGLNNIFQYRWVNETCEIIMRDGYETSFSAVELDQGILLSKFILQENETAFNYANLCFTAMVKRAQDENNDELEDMSFEAAANSLNNGEYYLEGPHWIGLRNHIKSIGRKYVWQYKGVIGASKKHCFFVSQGLEDNYGKIDHLGKFERRWCKWFRIMNETEL